MSWESDSYRTKGMRKKLVEEIRAKGIKDEQVLQAIGTVPRHLFLDPAFLESAYADQAFQIGEGQTISQPYTVAYQTVLLEVERGMKVLEIGTGSGYQACVLAEMGARVFSIERHKPLFEEARERLVELGYPRIKTFFGDGFRGLPSFAPFDRVLVTAAAPELPTGLVGQLRSGGLAVVPFGEGRDQTMVRLRLEPDGSVMREDFDRFRFVPMLKGKVY